ncbi:hypothetical protein EV363DRAFT_1199999 [Boletus edulis]|nr:hypothetical protein EV363DRAFT_1199999 [Boletus edulis]
MQENSPTVWEVKTALLGFTQMNSAHHGVRLGQALFMVIQRLGITHKTSPVIHSKEFDPKQPDEDLIARRGTQRDEVGVIWSICVKVHAPSTFYSILSNVTQERSSAKRKELFQTIQQQEKPNHPPREHPLQLILDMPIRWSSTYLMLDRAETLKDVSGSTCCIMSINLFLSRRMLIPLCTK